MTPKPIKYLSPNPMSNVRSENKWTVLSCWLEQKKQDTKTDHAELIEHSSKVISTLFYSSISATKMPRLLKL